MQSIFFAVVLPVFSVLIQVINIRRKALQRVHLRESREVVQMRQDIDLEIALDFLKSNYFKIAMGVVIVKFFSQFPFITATMVARVVTSPLTFPLIVTQGVSQVGIMISSILYFPLLSAMDVINWRETLYCSGNSVREAFCCCRNSKISKHTTNDLEMAKRASSGRRSPTGQTIS